jgi:hypothetical protein
MTETAGKRLSEFDYLVSPAGADMYAEQSGESKRIRTGEPNGLATLDGAGKIPSAQLGFSAMKYLGTYNATTNTPPLTDAGSASGDMYRVTVAGSRNFGSGAIALEVGDAIVHNGTTFERWDLVDQVRSVAGRGGDVVLATADIAGLDTALGLRAQLNVLQTWTQTQTFNDAAVRVQGWGGVAGNGVVYFGDAAANHYIYKNGNTFTIKAAGTITVDASITGTVWHSGNFNPATKVDTSGASMSGGLDWGATGVATGNDMSNHIRLHNAGYGFNVQTGTLGYHVGTSGQHVMHVNAVGIFKVDVNGPQQKYANSSSMLRIPRTFVQSADPGAAAADGDLWIW